MKIVIIGSGYVGLVVATCFAEIGHDVVCVDKDHRKIESLNRGHVPIYEPGLDELVSRNLACGRLKFTGDLEHALPNAHVAFIAVATPLRPTDGQADTKQFYEVAREICQKATGDLVVVSKSTVPVGTGDEVEKILLGARRPFRFAVVSNPEFLREGMAIEDFLRPDRVVIGSENDWARDVMSAIYGVGGLADTNIVHTSRRSAELTKYAANAFLAMKITFINEIADLCEAAGADIREVSYGVGLDSRIGAKFLNAGPGYGGSCFPKDTLAICTTARDHRVQLRTVETVIQVNDSRKRAMALRIVDACGGSVRGKTIAVLGLAFKADTDDMRDSPAISIIQALQDFGATLRAYDPKAMENAAAVLDNVKFCDDALTAANGADATVLLTEWTEFAKLDLVNLQKHMAGALIVDLRNLLHEKEVKAAGFEYCCIGRSDVTGVTLKHATAAE